MDLWADESVIATICQLLRPNVHPLRALLSLLEFSLVLRQIAHDRHATAVVQWNGSPLQLFLLPAAMGYISEHPRLAGRLGGFALRSPHKFDIGVGTLK